MTHAPGGVSPFAELASVVHDAALLVGALGALGVKRAWRKAAARSTFIAAHFCLGSLPRVFRHSSGNHFATTILTTNNKVN